MTILVFLVTAYRRPDCLSSFPLDGSAGITGVYYTGDKGTAGNVAGLVAGTDTSVVVVVLGSDTCVVVESGKSVCISTREYGVTGSAIQWG